MTKKWIQAAHLKAGAYGHGKKITSKRISKDVHSHNTTTRKRAVLARTFRKMAAAHRAGRAYHGSASAIKG